MALSPRASAAFIARRAKHVKILEEGVEKVADLVSSNFQKKAFCFSGLWDSNEMNPRSRSLPFILDWIFVVDTLNFSFWTREAESYTVTYKNKTYSGYWSLCAAINRAVEEGFEMTSPDFYSTVSLGSLKHIFRSDGGVEIPLLRERHSVLNETGKCLQQKFNSTFATCVSMAGKSAAKLLEIILENFPSYRDEAEIEGEKVAFYKRAQILVSDIWLCFEGKDSGEFYDIDQLTVFADYRVPQALAYLGVLSYSDELTSRLKKDELLNNGERYEVEIRGCTIWAVELILERIKKSQENGGGASKNVSLNSVLIDYFLWEYRRAHENETNHIPYHKVRCIYY